MKAFVTGGTGFVGSHLIDRLLAKKCRGVCVKKKNIGYEMARRKKNQLCRRRPFFGQYIERHYKEC